MSDTICPICDNKIKEDLMISIEGELIICLDCLRKIILEDTGTRFYLRVAIARELEAMGKKSEGMRFRTLSGSDGTSLLPQEFPLLDKGCEEEWLDSEIH